MDDDHNMATPTSPLDDKIVESSLDFPVVGLGASAGGVQALLSFLENLPVDTGMAFVIVMHLSPTHESNACAVLQRATTMPVQEVKQLTYIACNNVYVISPKLQLEMNDGYLRVRAAERPIGQHVAIDLFFRTLADVHRSRSFGIILSGTGADGAVGLARLKEQGGVTIAQDPDDAEYDGMPLAAVHSGMVDFVLPVALMPQKLIDLWRNARSIILPPLEPSAVPAATVKTTTASALPASPGPARTQFDTTEQALRDVLALLHTRTGHDFRHYKRATVLRRIERRLQVREVADLVAYRNLLKNDPGECDALLNDMLIGVTQFFRDSEAFDALACEVLPQIFEGRAEHEQVRVWSAACSTGEEAYSLAILLKEQAQRRALPPAVQVFATDIDERAIAVARAGVYPQAIETDVSPTRLRNWFLKDGVRYRVVKPVRDTVLFAAQNIMRDPPFSKLDLISCRNLLIYLNRDRHAQILEMFHFALGGSGYLFLGGSESAESLSDYFVPVDKKHRLYRARPLAHTAQSPMAFRSTLSVPHAAGMQAPPVEIRKFSFAEVHQRALVLAAAPSALVNHSSETVYLSAGAGAFLHHAVGEPSRNLVAMVAPELRLELRTALFQALRGGKTIETQRIRIERDGCSEMVSMTAQPVRDPVADADFVLVLFRQSRASEDAPADNAQGGQRDAVIAGLEEDILRTKVQLQDTIEQAETSTEELKASYEELQAINGELRLATEELETSKEELQSVNEELITVNSELKRKVDETSKSNDDLQNLIVSTDIATIFVDRQMHIKRFTPRATDIFNILPGDVGRSLHDITHRLSYPELAGDGATTFATLHGVEREVSSSNGRAYLARVLPYRTDHDRIEGAILTFIDITRRQDAEARVLASEARMHLVAESMMDYAIITLDANGLITSFNKGAERIFGHREEDVLGSDFALIFTPEDRAAGAPEQERSRAREVGRADDERWHLRRDGTRVYCSGVTTRLGEGAFHGYAKIARDVAPPVTRAKPKANKDTGKKSARDADAGTVAQNGKNSADATAGQAPHTSKDTSA